MGRRIGHIMREGSGSRLGMRPGLITNCLVSWRANAHWNQLGMWNVQKLFAEGGGGRGGTVASAKTFV